MKTLHPLTQKDIADKRALTAAIGKLDATKEVKDKLQSLVRTYFATYNGEERYENLEYKLNRQGVELDNLNRRLLTAEKEIAHQMACIRELYSITNKISMMRKIGGN